MARKTGQIIGRGPQRWMVRINIGRDPETCKRRPSSSMSITVNLAGARLRANSFCDYSGLITRSVRSRLGARPLGELSPAEIQALYSEMLNRKLYGTDDSLHACGPGLGVAAGGTLEAPPDEPGRACRSATAFTATFHRVRCRADQAVHRRDCRALV
jgi:hypothetical protein